MGEHFDFEKKEGGIPLIKINSRIIFILVTVFLLTFVFNTVGFTAPTQDSSKIIYQKEIIKNNDVLFDRAVKGLTDKDGDNFIPKAILVNDQTGEENSLETISTTQLAKIEKLSNDTVKKSYVTTSFVALSYDGSQYKSKYDGSQSVKAYSTIYWDEVNYSGDPITYIDLISVDGGWTTSNSVSVQNRKVRLGQAGFTYTNGYKSYTSMIIIPQA